MKNTDHLYPDPLLVRISHWKGENAIYVLENRQRMSTSKGWITVPAGFLTDGLSIPAFAWPIVGPRAGRAFRSGILHDYLYSRESEKYGIDRKGADKLFLEVMFNLGIGWFQRGAIYRAVRIFGDSTYKKR